MTKKKTKLRILREARKQFIARGWKWPAGVCAFIHHAGSEYGRESEAEELVDWIAKILWPHLYLHNWLASQHGIEHNSPDPFYAPDDPFYAPDDYKRRLHATRVAWLDWMIKQVEKGK